MQVYYQVYDQVAGELCTTYENHGHDHLHETALDLRTTAPRHPSVAQVEHFGHRLAGLPLTKLESTLG